MESDIDKRAMLEMKSGKRYMTEGIGLPNKNKTKQTLGEKEINKYVGVLETDTIKQEEIKEKKIRKKTSEETESYSRQNCISETLSKE